MSGEPLVYTRIGPMAESGCGTYSGTLTNEDGETPVPGAALNTLTLSLLDADTGEVINGRDAQNVLNANGVTVDETSGRIHWDIAKEDTVFLRKSPPPLDGDIEVHVAVFTWTWNGGTSQGRKKVFLLVEKYHNAPVNIGTGSTEYTSYLYADTEQTIPVDDAQVWITSDSAGDTLVAGPITTNTDGSFTFMLDPGTYYLWASHPEYTFPDATPIEVT